MTTKLNKYLNVEDLCGICAIKIIFNENNDGALIPSLALNKMCDICRNKYNLNKALSFAEKKGGKEYWRNQWDGRKVKSHEYYMKNRKKIRADQKERRESRKTK